MSSVLANRHDVLVLFDVVQGNPNGDPDAGNMPRIDPNTNKGIVTDVCLKRKVRNYVELVQPPTEQADGGEPGNAFEIMVRQGAVIERAIVRGITEAEETVGGSASDDTKAEAACRHLCRRFFDIRAFGGVLSVGKDVLRGSAYGQVRGPVQFTFAQSFHPITAIEITITRCAVTKEEDKDKERTMGQKFVVPYALYAAKCYVSPPFATRTGFTKEDLELFFEALSHMFDHDRSAARGEMVVRGIYDFEHVGTQSDTNAGQNAKEAALGCAHAHKLFEGVHVRLREGREFPEGFEDYEVACEWDSRDLPNGVRLHKRHE
jgi:CRISPR-associated protein Csd2